MTERWNMDFLIKMVTERVYCVGNLVHSIDEPKDKNSVSVV